MKTVFLVLREFVVQNIYHTIIIIIVLFYFSKKTYCLRMNGTNAKFVDYNLKDPHRHHICNFDLRSIVHRQYVLM